MLSVSERFKKAFEQVDKPRKIKAIVTLKNVSYKNDQLFHVEYNSEAISGDTFAIGSTFSNNIKVTIDKVVEGIKQQDQLTYLLGIVVEPNETELADMKSKGYTWDVIEYVPMGTFFVTSYNPDRNENRTIIEASDSMSFLESTYSSNLTYPAYLKDIALDVANKNGLVVDSGSLSRLPQIQIKRPEKVSYRQVLGIIAQYQKGFATFDRQNRLAIRALNDPKYTVSTNNYFLKGLVKEELLYKVDGISCKVEKEDQTTVLQAGKTTGNQIVLENSSMTQIDLNTIFSGLSTLNYYPYSLKWRGNPALEVGDWISLNDIKTNSFKVPNLSYKLTFSGGLTAESSAHTKSISEITVQYRGPLNQKIEDITGWISAAGGFSYTGLDEPQNPKEKDVWFKPNGPDMEMWIFENGKWKLETSTADVRELSEAFEESNKKIEQAEEDLAQAKLDLTQNGKDIEQNKLDILDNIDKTTAAKTELDQAKTDLVIAAGKIDANKTYMDQVKAQADEIDKKADDAKTIADGANTLATSANKASANAATVANDAKALASTAKTNADKAISDASSAISNANTAKSNATTALTNANTAITNAANVDQKVTTEVKRIDGELSSKATKTTVDTLSGTVTNQGTLITQTQNDIKIKANQSTVDTLNQTVQNQSASISANAKAIELKASQTDVNVISGRVTSTESTIKVHSDSIKSLVTKTDGTNSKVVSLEQNVEGFKTAVAEQYVTNSNLEKLTLNSMISNGDFTAGLTYWEKKVGSVSISTNTEVGTHVVMSGNSLLDYKGILNLIGGRVYKVTFKGYRATNWTGDYSNTKLRIADSNNVAILGLLVNGTAGVWNDYSYTMRPTKDILNAHMTLGNTASNTGVVAYTFVKIEDITDVDTVTTKVSTVQQDINGITTTVSEVQKGLNTTNINLVEVKTTVSGIQTTLVNDYETKAGVTLKVNSVKTTVDGVSETLSKEYTKKEVLEGISTTSNMVSNPGFVEMLYWSTSGKTTYLPTGGYGGRPAMKLEGTAGITYKPSLYLEVGRIYEIGIWALVTSDYAGGGNTKVRLARKVDHVAYWQNQLDLTVKGKWVEYKKTITGNNNSINTEFTFNTDGSSGFVAYCLPSITDVTELIDNRNQIATLDKTVQGFRQTVQDTYETKTEVNRKITAVETTASKFQSTVGELYATKKALDDTTPGGENLLVGATTDKFNVGISTYTGAPSKWMNMNMDDLGIKIGDDVTFSVYVENWSTGIRPVSARISLSRADGTYVTTVDTNSIKPNSKGWTSVTVTRTSEFVKINCYLARRDIVDVNNEQTFNVTCNSDMLQIGNKRSGWVPSASYEFSQIKQTVGKIDLSVVKKDSVVSAINLNPEGIRLKGNLIYLDGNSYIANGVIKDAHIADATITSASIANLAVTTAKIAKLAVTDALIANATITAASIADLAITSAKIGNLAVTNAKIGDLAVNGAKIANAAITETKIGDAAIVNAHIKDATIESAKIKSINAEKITAGTLNAANVNIINLNANNITSGNINGINITGSTITSQKGSSRIVLDGGALSWYVSNGLVGSIYTNEDSGITQASWDVYDAGYFSIRGKGSYDGEVYMRYGWAGLSSIVSGKVSIVSKNKNADRSTSLELNNSQIILNAGSGSGSSYKYGTLEVNAYGVRATGGMTISGGLSVTGSKNAIHQVDGQWYATPAYETAESYLGDIGSTTTNNDSMVLISIDSLFGRIVNTSLEYQVFVSSYGSGHVWVEKRMQNAFVVHSSEPNTKFAWEIKAKRKGYEQERLVKHSLIA